MNTAPRHDGEEQFRLLADNAPVMIWRSDTSKACDFFNRPWLEFTGRSMEQELGFGWAEGVHPDDHDRCMARYTQAFDVREPFGMDYRLRRHDGVYRWVLDNGRPYHDASGRFAGYFGSCIDITERKVLEENLRRTLAARDSLVHELQHRLRNNLAVVASLLTLQASRAEEPGAGPLLHRSADRVRRIAMVQDLAHASLVGAEVDIDRFVAKLATDLLARRKGIEVETDLATALRLPLSQALTFGLACGEALANIAAHAFPDKRPGKARISGAQTDRELQFVFADNGIGLPSRAESANGPGLGCMLMRELLSQLGGRFGVERDDGTRLILALPVQAGS